MKSIWQGTGLEAQAFFEDEGSKEPVLPSTAHWRLYCETTQQALSDFTASTVTQVQDSFGNVSAHTITIDVPGTLNAIQNTRNATEVKALTVVADKDTAREYSEVFRYVVRRNRAR
jgi:hypothetical protein